MLYRERSGGGLFTCTRLPIAGAFSIQRLEGSRFGTRALWILDDSGAVVPGRKVGFSSGSERLGEWHKKIPSQCPRAIELTGTLWAMALEGAADPSWKRSCHECWGTWAGGERNLRSTGERRSSKSIGPPHCGQSQSERSDETAHVAAGRAGGAVDNN